MQRGDWGNNGQPSPRAADQAHAWKKQTAIAEHELPGTARHDPLAYLQNRTVDWLDHQLAARELLDLDVANTHLVMEHEYPKARIQDRERLKPILQGSIAFVRRNRRSGGVHVRPAARSAAGAGNPRSGNRPRAVPIMTSAEGFMSRMTASRELYRKARLFLVSSLALTMAGVGASLRANTATDLQRVFLDPDRQGALGRDDRERSSACRFSASR